MVIFVITATSNAVNLTDGLDGLAIGNVGIVCFTLAIITYVSGHALWSQFLLFPTSGKRRADNLLCSNYGCIIRFLWFNSHPAQIFMGDTGSLALGRYYWCNVRPN